MRLTSLHPHFALESTHRFTLILRWTVRPGRGHEEPDRVPAALRAHGLRAPAGPHRDRRHDGAPALPPGPAGQHPRHGGPAHSGRGRGRHGRGRARIRGQPEGGAPTPRDASGQADRRGARAEHARRSATTSAPSSGSSARRTAPTPCGLPAPSASSRPTPGRAGSRPPRTGPPRIARRPAPKPPVVVRPIPPVRHARRTPYQRPAVDAGRGSAVSAASPVLHGFPWRAPPIRQPAGTLSSASPGPRAFVRVRRRSGTQPRTRLQ